MQVLQQKGFERSPHTAAAAAVITQKMKKVCENGDCAQKEVDVASGLISPLDEIIDNDNAAVARASILGEFSFCSKWSRSNWAVNYLLINFD